MRDRLARAVACALLLSIVLMAGFFARRENPPPRGEDEALLAEPAPPAVPAIDLDPALVQRGHEIYERSSCQRCHALDGQGNPRSPLDQVGSRRTRDEIRRWVTASDPVRGFLSRSAVRAKEALAADLSDADLDALVEYLASRR